MVWNDTDLGLSPFVPITAADERALAAKLAERDLPGLPYEQRVLIAYEANRNPDWDAMRIHDTLDIDHGVVVPIYLIEAFLAGIR